MDWKTLLPMLGVGGIGGMATKGGRDFLFGSEDKFNKLPTMTQGQTGLLNQLIEALSGKGGQAGGGQMALQHLMELLDPSSQAYEKFADPYMRQFEQETVPGLAERFAGLGGGMGGGLSSSGFGQALSSAGANLQSNLASMKTGMQSQAANNILQQLQQALGQQTFAYGHQPANPGVLAQGFGAFAQGAGKAFGGGF